MLMNIKSEGGGGDDPAEHTKKPRQLSITARMSSQNEKNSSSSSRFHIAMFPWFAIGHMTPFLHLSNEFAKRGHKISFLLPSKALTQLQHLNLHPDLITFHPLTLPHVEGLPPGTQTASDIPIFLVGLLAAAMDLMRDQIRALLCELKPHFVFFDFQHWVPEFSAEIGFKTVCYSVVCAASLAIGLVPGLEAPKTEEDGAGLMVPPPGYPSTKVLLRKHEARSLSFLFKEFGNGITFYERVTTAMSRCDAISIRTCTELEGALCDYLGSKYGKPVILTGPVLPEPSRTPLEDNWAKWLDKFDTGSVVFCAFGTQVNLKVQQFQELVLGFELTGLPFLVALRTPDGASSIEEALPEGFEERTRGRGMIHGDMVPQPVILSHPSVGCFVSHCGFGSMWESLMSHSQIVLVPHLGDQILNTRLLAEELEVAVEVEREEDGWFGKESLCRAIRSAMDKDSKVGITIRENHANWRKTILKPDFSSNYINEFMQQLHHQA